MIHFLRQKNSETFSDLNLRSRSAGEELLWRAGQGALLLFAMFLAYVRCIDLTVLERLFLAFMLAAALFACTAAAFFGPFGRYAGLLPLAGALLVFLAAGPAFVARGFFGALGQMVAWWNLRYEDGLVLFRQTEVPSGSTAAFSAILLLFVTAGIWRALEKKSLPGLAVLILCVNLPALLVGRFHPLAFALTVTAVAAVWVYAFSQANLSHSLFWVGGIGLVSVCMAVSLGMQDDPQTQSLREQVSDGVQMFRYGEDTLPQGDLSRAGEMFSKDESTLTVTSSQVKDLYLRGFIGGRYESGKWLPLKKSAYGGGQSGMLRWLTGQNFHAVTQYADALSAYGEDVPESNTVTVTNTGANRRYAYLTYSAEYPDEAAAARENRDSQFTSRALLGIRDYTFQEDGPNLPMELTQRPSWMQDPQKEAEERYLNAESVYRNFVYRNYLELTSEQEALMKQIFHSENPGEDPVGVYAAAERIRTTLEGRVRYRRQPQQPSENEDPVVWFLTKGREGNAALYASASVLAFRSFGIPARYAEGYLVRASALNGSDDGSVELRTGDSHVWAEVYLDGLGWVPVDTTPGFYYTTYSLVRMVEKPNGIQLTAAEEKTEEKADELQDQLSDGRGGRADEKTKTGERLYTAAAALLLMLAVPVLLLLILAAALRVCTSGYRTFICEKLPANRRAEFYCRHILLLAGALGVTARIGWKAGETEEALRALFPEIPEGRYRRANDIMEKFVYGGVLPLPHEERVLSGLLESMDRGIRKLPLKSRFRLLAGMLKEIFRFQRNAPESPAES